MKRLYAFGLTTLAALLLIVGLTGCEVEVGEDGPVEDVVEEVED